MATDYICNGCIRALRYRTALGIPGRTISRHSRLHAVPNRRLFNSSQYAAKTASAAKPPSSSSKPKNSPSGAAPKPAVETTVPKNNIKEVNGVSSSTQTSSDGADESSPFRAALGDLAKGIAGSYSQEYMVYGAAEEMFKLCAHQADYDIPQAAEKDGEIPKTAADEDLGVGSGWWYSELGLTPTFNTWAQITMLYMYALTVRLRCLPASEFALFQQHLNNACFAAAEHRMISLHRINLSGMRQRYLKDLFGQWRGVSVAYDEGLIRGDAVLATAIWRNIFKADQDVDVEKVAAVTSYLRRLLRMLDKMGDAQIRRVVIQWPGLEQEEVLVRAESPQLKAPFVETAKV